MILLLSYVNSILLILSFLNLVTGSQILTTSGFISCLPESNITVQNLDIKYNADEKLVTFDVTGTSLSEQNVTAQLNVVAYGINVYHRSFDPCSTSTYVSHLCPVPEGQFLATGTQVIPDEYASQIPRIAFSVPDISATATLELMSLDTQTEVACIRANVNNGKTAHTPAVSYVAAGIAGAALIMTGATTAGAAAGVAGGGVATGGSSAPSAVSTTPSFIEVFSWFQGLAMNGMISVNYPPIYRSFTKNFAFSTGIIPWTAMQTSIDNFRARTGGNLTENSVQYLRDSKTGYMVGVSKISRRAHDSIITARDSISTSVDSTGTSSTSNITSQSPSQVETTLNGIKAYVEELSVPEANTFLTVLLIVACVIATIVVGILLCKVVLETWALFGSFPKSLAGFRKHYWATMARSIVQLILVLYGIWVLYCIFQFTNGDSWAAKTLAAASLTIVSGVLVYFAFKIWQTASKLKEMDGDASGLYRDKENWLKYSMFYDSYSKDYWWMFIPVIFYMFAKGCILAAGNGHGFGQTISQLIIELLMLGLLIWKRPFERRSGNVINIIIQVVRGLSVACILVFVEELGISQTTQTVTGVVLIAVQSILTGVLALLIATNAIIVFCKQNPHRKRRKAANQNSDDLDFTDSPAIEKTLTVNPQLSKGGLGDKSNPKFVCTEPELKPKKNRTSSEPINVYEVSLPKRQMKPYFRTERSYRSESLDGLIDNSSSKSHMDDSGGYRGVAF
ncbi:Flavin carrier protein 2 [Erysiphe neolycopersici]|uniref:Flavin carrier protein 2 n=1 Tax=Erysiphe neolycopersici TaxID=212602 RepID=A0A420HQX2_9PEZI|nr:Flavin carrier protein 2 [Erysiphe neolycopersici]